MIKNMNTITIILLILLSVFTGTMIAIYRKISEYIKSTSDKQKTNIIDKNNRFGKETVTMPEIKVTEDFKYGLSHGWIMTDSNV